MLTALGTIIPRWHRRAAVRSITATTATREGSGTKERVFCDDLVCSLESVLRAVVVPLRIALGRIVGFPEPPQNVHQADLFWIIDLREKALKAEELKQPYKSLKVKI